MLMKRWIPAALLATAALAAGWLLGRLRSDSADATEFIIPKNPEDPTALVRRAQALWRVAPGQAGGRQALQFIRYLAETLDDREWWAVTGAAGSAWDQCHSGSEFQSDLASVNDAVVPRFVKSGSVDEDVMILRRISWNSPDATQLAGLLSRLASAPLPGSEFPGSPQERLVAAAVQVGDLPRAKEYLASLAPAAAASPPVGRSREMIDLLLTAAEGKLDLARLMQFWAEERATVLGRQSYQPALEDAVLACLPDPQAKIRRPSLEELLAQSRDQGGAEAFWGRILFRLRPKLVRGGELAVIDAARIVLTYARMIHQPSFEHDFWMRSAELTTRWNPDDPRRAARYYRRAKQAATTDGEQLAAVKGFAFQCQRANDSDLALGALDELLGVIHDATLKKEVEQLAREIRESALKVNASLASRRQFESDSLRRLLAQTKDLLQKAIQEHRTEEVQILRGMIQDLESQLKE